MSDIESPFPDSLPFKEVIETLADNNIASLHEVLPDTMGHPYDTTLSAEKPHQDVPTYEGPVTDIRTKFDRRRSRWLDVPAGTVLRGTVQFHTPSMEHEVHAAVNTHTRSTEPEYGEYGEAKHVMYIPVDKLNDQYEATLHTLREAAGKLGLLRIVADIRIPGKVEDGGIIESVYALQRPFDYSRDPSGLYTSMYPHILEGAITEIDQEHDFRTNTFPKKLRRELTVFNGKGTHNVAVINPLQYASGSPVASYEKPNPDHPIVGDYVQMQVYPNGNGALRNGPHYSVPSIDVRNGLVPVLSLRGTSHGSERWSISHKAKATFDAYAAKATENFENPDVFRDMYGQWLLCFIKEDGSFSFTNNELEKLKAVQESFEKAAQQHDKDINLDDVSPLGLRIDSVTGDYIAATYGENVFAMTKEQYKTFVHDVITGDVPARDTYARPPKKIPLTKPVLLGVPLLKDTQLTKEVCSKVLDTAVPWVVTTASTRGEYKLVNDAIRLIPELPQPETHMESLFGAAHLIYSPENYVPDQCWDSITSTLKLLLDDSIKLTYPQPTLSNGEPKSFCLESIAGIRNADVIAAFLARLPQILSLVQDDPNVERNHRYDKHSLEQMQQKLAIIADFQQRQQQREQNQDLI
jgi:hypothetical protein